MSEEEGNKSFETAIISKLIVLLRNGGPEDKIRKIEELIVDDLKNFVDVDRFYDLPITEIVKLLRSIELVDEQLLAKVFKKAQEVKGDESILLLNFINPQDTDFHECVKIISEFDVCPLFKHLKETYDEEMKLTVVDFEGKYNESLEEIKKLKRKVKELEEKKGENIDDDDDHSYNSDDMPSPSIHIIRPRKIQPPPKPIKRNFFKLIPEPLNAERKPVSFVFYNRNQNRKEEEEEEDFYNRHGIGQRKTQQPPEPIQKNRIIIPTPPKPEYRYAEYEEEDEEEEEVKEKEEEEEEDHDDDNHDKPNPSVPKPPKPIKKNNGFL